MAKQTSHMRHHFTTFTQQSPCGSRKPRTLGLNPPTKAPRSHRHIRVVAALTTAKQKSSHGNLKDPARLAAAGRCSTRVEDKGGAVALDNYMVLPAEQYYELDPELIVPLGGNKFKLQVPKLQLFNVFVEPEVWVSVIQDPGPPYKVILQADDCKLNGSPLLQRLQLDQRFKLNFLTELTWDSGYSNGNGSPATNVTTSQIHADLQLEVYTEVIPPFDMLPRNVLEGTCNTVLAGLVKTLLPIFVKKLGQDYTKWATNEGYRKKRAGLSSTSAQNS